MRNIDDICNELDISPSQVAKWEKTFPDKIKSDAHEDGRVYNKASVAFIRELRNLVIDKGYSVAQVRRALSKPQGELWSPSQVTAPKNAFRADKMHEYQHMLRVIAQDLRRLAGKKAS